MHLLMLLVFNLWNFSGWTVFALNSSISDKCLQDNKFYIYPEKHRLRHLRSVANTSGPLTLPIGTIFNAHDHQIRSSFRLAIALYNRQSDIPFIIGASTEITDVSDNYQIATALCSQMTRGVFLFYGMKHINSKDTIEAYTREFHMPYISPSLSRVVTKFQTPFQVHMKPSYTFAIIDMIRHYKWKAVHYLYDSDEGLQRLQVIYQNADLDLGFRRLSDVDHSHEELKHLDKFIMHHFEKAIILDLSSQQAYESILKQIAEVGMNKHSYFYLLATLDFSKLNFERFLHGGVNLTGFDLVSEDNAEIREFNKEWKKAGSTEYAGSDQPLTSDSAMAVDALRLIVDTFTRMLSDNQLVFRPNFRRGKVYNSNYSKSGIPCNKQNLDDPPPIPWMHGENITHYLKQADFEGLTGHVSFDQEGFRKNYTLNVSTVGQDQGPVRIGQWTPQHGYRTLHGGPTTDFPDFRSQSMKRITTIQSPPFLMLKENPTKNGKILVGNDRYEGYSVDLAMGIGKFMNFNFTLSEVKDSEYGIKRNGTWSGMIGELVRGEADMAIAPLTITYDREKDVDFTKPFMNIGISIMIKKPDIEKPGVFSFMQPLDVIIWICIVVAYAAVSVGLFLVSRCSPYEWKKIASKGGYANEFSILNSFWFSTGALMLQGSDTCPRSMSGRIIGTVWWFFVLIIISTYTANLAAFLTVERMVAPIESADDLAKQTEIKYGTIASGTTREFFKTSKVQVYQAMWHFMSTHHDSVMVNKVDTGIARVRDSKGKYAFLLESSVNEYINSREPCDTIKVGRNLNSKGFGIATPSKDPIRDEINLAVLTLKEDGHLHKLQQKWWSDKSQCASDSGKESSGKRPLSLSNVAGVFYILIGGLVSAVVLAAIEFGMKRLRLVPKVRQQPAYMKGTETATSLIDTPSERENGDVVDYQTPPPHYPADFSQDKNVRTYTYGTPQLIGFEALDDRNTHTDV